MRGRHLDISPSLLGLRLLHERLHHCSQRAFSAKDKRARQRLPFALGSPYGLLVSPEGLGHQLRTNPAHVFLGYHAERLQREGREAPPFSFRLCLCAKAISMFLGHQVETTLAIFGNEGVDENKMLQALRGAFGNSRHDHPRIAVANENDLLEVFEDEHFQDILDVRTQVDIRSREMRAIAQSRQRRRSDLVARIA
jgi:hypothetical protein